MEPKTKGKVKITKDGPYIVTGGLPLDKEIEISDELGVPVRWQKGEQLKTGETYSLCRCGASKHHPFCDATHLKIKFNGTETCSRVDFVSQMETYTGPGLVLRDAERYCAVALFCHGGKGAWDLTEDSGNEENRKTAIQQACDCPSGRLVAVDKKTGQPIEPHFEPSLSLIEDPGRKCSGALWVKGGVPIESADGHVYEVRNRATLCRCGASKNKPFCDGTHVKIKFSDGDKSLKATASPTATRK